MSPYLSFIIVSYNTADSLAACLESIRDHAPADREVLVVDNASTDGSPEMVRARFPEARLLEQPENLGFPAGVNAGLRAARGELLTVLNSDVVLQTGAVQALAGALEADSAAGIAGPAQFTPAGRPLLTVHRDPSLWGEVVETFLFYDAWRYRAFGAALAGRVRHTIQVDWLSGSALMVKAEALAAIGGMDENVFLYGEEQDWQRRAREAGWRVLYVPGAAVVHEKGASAGPALGRGRLAAVTRSHYYFQAKNHGLARLLAVVPLRVVRSLLRAALGLPLFFFAPGRAAGHLREHAAVVRKSLDPQTYAEIRAKLERGAQIAL